MPNHCYNRVHISNDVEDNTEQFDKLVAIFESKKPFSQIITIPDFSKIKNEDGELPVRREHKNPKTGEVSFVTMEFPKSGKNDDRWYDWNISNWDTKWDIAGGVEVDDYDDEQVEFNFNTAWSPPEAICRKLRELFPEVGFSWFYDEPGMEVAGYL